MGERPRRRAAQQPLGDQVGARRGHEAGQHHGHPDAHGQLARILRVEQAEQNCRRPPERQLEDQEAEGPVQDEAHLLKSGGPLLEQPVPQGPESADAEHDSHGDGDRDIADGDEAIDEENMRAVGRLGHHYGGDDDYGARADQVDQHDLSR